jgi:type IV secretion system protein VirD4
MRTLPRFSRTAPHPWVAGIIAGLSTLGLLTLEGCYRNRVVGAAAFVYPPTQTANVIVSIIAGALVGAFFSERFRPFRKYLGYALLALLVFAGFNAEPPWSYITWFVVAAIVTARLLRVVRGAGREQRPTTFGSAEWADRDHILKNKLNGDAGLWLGTFSDGNGAALPLHYTGDRHLLTVAPTRAGKGVSAIIPNLLTYTGSALIIDPKGENALITAKQRHALGQDIHLVDPWGLTGMESSRFNPLEWLRAGDPDVGENAFMLADAMVVKSGKGDDQFWNDEAVALLWGFILYAAIHPAAEERTLGAVRDIITAGPKDLKVVLDAMVNSGNLIMESTAARTLAKDEKTRANVFTTLQSHTHFLDSPRMRESLSVSDFRFEDLKATKMTIYLVLPADRLGTFGRWLRLLIQQAITVNARNIEAKPDKPILFLLDEMAALGKLTKVEEAYGLMAGFGMQLWGIVQDLSQLDRIYDKGWETFIGNSGVLQYFGSRDLKTAEYFSKLCGVGTIIKVSISRSIARVFGQGGAGSTTNTEGTNTDHIQRQLAFPDELMVLRKNQSLLLIENFNPIQAEKITWYTDQRLKDKGNNLNQKVGQAGNQIPATRV